MIKYVIENLHVSYIFLKKAHLSMNEETFSIEDAPS